jgi:hypothetical protein
MAFFDPVDPSTESLLWPGRVGFCIVAELVARRRLLLFGSAVTEQKREGGGQSRQRRPVVRE